MYNILGVFIDIETTGILIYLGILLFFFVFNLLVLRLFRLRKVFKTAAFLCIATYFVAVVSAIWDLQRPDSFHFFDNIDSVSNITPFLYFEDGFNKVHPFDYDETIKNGGNRRDYYNLGQKYLYYLDLHHKMDKQVSVGQVLVTNKDVINMLESSGLLGSSKYYQLLRGYALNMVDSAGQNVRFLSVNMHGPGNDEFLHYDIIFYEDVPYELIFKEGNSYSYDFAGFEGIYFQIISIALFVLLNLIALALFVSLKRFRRKF